MVSEGSASSPGEKGAPGEAGHPDSPLVVRLPKGKTGEGLVLPCGPAEGVLSSLVGEPWATTASIGPTPKIPGPHWQPRLPEMRA